MQLEEKESKGISCKYRKSLFAVTQPETIKGSIFMKNSSAAGCGREYWGFCWMESFYALKQKKCKYWIKKLNALGSQWPLSDWNCRQQRKRLFLHLDKSEWLDYRFYGVSCPVGESVPQEPQVHSNNMQRSPRSPLHVSLCGDNNLFLSPSGNVSVSGGKFFWWLLRVFLS